MKKIKLNLDELKVESFETQPKKPNQKGTIVGEGPQTVYDPSCATHCEDTCNTCAQPTCDGTSCVVTLCNEYTCAASCNICTQLPLTFCGNCSDDASCHKTCYQINCGA